MKTPIETGVVGDPGNEPSSKPGPHESIDDTSKPQLADDVSSECTTEDLDRGPQASENKGNGENVSEWSLVYCCDAVFHLNLLNLDTLV